MVYLGINMLEWDKKNVIEHLNTQAPEILSFMKNILKMVGGRIYGIMTRNQSVKFILLQIVLSFAAQHALFLHGITLTGWQKLVRDGLFLTSENMDWCC